MADSGPLKLAVIALDDRGRRLARALEADGYEVLVPVDAAACAGVAAIVCAGPITTCAAEVRSLRAAHDFLSVPLLHVSSGPLAPDELAFALAAGFDGFIDGGLELDGIVRALERSLLRALVRRREVGRQIAAALLDAVCVIDADGRFIELNSACEAIFGYRTDELVGRRYIDLVHPADVARTNAVAAAIMQGQPTRAFENRYRRGDGTLAHILWSAHWSETDQVMYAVAREVTERRRLLASYESYFSTSGDLLAQVGFDGLIERVNPAFEKLLGWSAAELEGHPVLDFIHPDDLRHVASSYSEAVRSSLQPSFECRALVKGGGSRLVSWSGHIDRDDHLIYVAGRDITESRNLAERLHTMLESMSDALFTIDREWRLTYVNPVFERNSQLARADLIGRRFLDIFPQLVGSEAERRYRLALETGDPQHFEFHSPAGPRWFEIHAYPSLEGLIVYYREVTERVLIQKDLRESEERFRLLSRATRDAIWDWDVTTDRLIWNEGFETLFGYRRDEIAQNLTAWSDRLHPDEREHVTAGLEAVIAHGPDTWSDEYRFRRADGSWAWVLDRGYVLRDEAGRVVRMIGGMTDLTERRETEDRLAAQAALLDSARDAILVRSLDGVIRYWNKGAERLYGWSAEEVRGRSVRELIYRDQAPLDAANEALVRDGEWHGEVTQVTRDGRDILVDGSWSLSKGRDGREEVLVIATDITERRKLETQFLRAQRLESIGTLAGGIAHDLNNVLAPILMSIELLKMSTTDHDSLEILETIGSSAKRGSDMVRQVLTFARGVTGERVVIDPRTLIADVRKILLETLPKSIRLEIETPGQWLVRGDPTQLHQVLINLCVNARDAMPHGGTLRVALEERLIEDTRGLEPGARPGAFVIISVSDTGHGMTPEVLARIFDPFFTTKPVGSGTGLGLPTVQAIIKSHRGWLGVYSEPGVGSAFRVYLPAELQEAVRPREGEQAPLPRGRGELVLVVDDEISIRTITRQTLESFGYRVLTAQDGAEAVSIFARQWREIAVVLTDMMMPVMDGAATIAAMQRIHPGVRIIAASGLSSNGPTARSIGLGVHAFLEKPFAAEAVLRAVASALGRGPGR